MILHVATSEPDQNGLYVASVNGGWKILEWVNDHWCYPGTRIQWRPEDVQCWLGPLPPEKMEYDL